MRRGRRDANHAAIRDALRDIPGVDVEDTADLGNGFPDLVVGWSRHPDRAWLFEVKDPSKPPSARQLTPKEEAFRARWPGHYAVVLTLEDCLREMGLRT